MSKKRADDLKQPSDAAGANPAGSKPAAEIAAKPKATEEAARSEAAKPESAKTLAPDWRPAVLGASVAAKLAAMRLRLMAHFRTAAPTIGHAWPTAAALICALGLGWAGGAMHVNDPEPASQARAAELDARLGQMAEQLRALREMASAAAHPQKGQVADAGKAVIEKLDRDRADHATRLGNLAAAVERIEKQDRDIAARVAQLIEKADHIERLTAPATTASIPQSAKPALQPLPKPDAEALSPRVSGWTVREVAGGLALLENPRGELVEIAPGETFRDLGRVKKIERRGRKWVVLTDKGLVE